MICEEWSPTDRRSWADDVNESWPWTSGTDGGCRTPEWCNRVAWEALPAPTRLDDCLQWFWLYGARLQVDAAQRAEKECEGFIKGKNLRAVVESKGGRQARASLSKAMDSRAASLRGGMAHAELGTSRPRKVPEQGFPAATRVPRWNEFLNAKPVPAESASLGCSFCQFAQSKPEQTRPEDTAQKRSSIVSQSEQSQPAQTQQNNTGTANQHGQSMPGNDADAPKWKVRKATKKAKNKEAKRRAKQKKRYTMLCTNDEQARCLSLRCFSD